MKSLSGLPNPWESVLFWSVCRPGLLRNNKELWFDGVFVHDDIDWAVDQATRMNEIELKVERVTDEEKAASLVDAMLRAGLAEKM